MNYNTYKFKLFLESLLDKFFETIWYIPRKLYKTNIGFKNFIDNNQNKSEVKRNNRKLQSMVFNKLRYINKVVILEGRNIDMEFPVDLSNYGYEKFLDDDIWINKNGLKIERATLYEYMEKNYDITVTDKYLADKKIYIVSK